MEMEDPSQDGCQALVVPFQALTSNAHQRRALNALVKALTHQQIRELRLSLGEVDLRCDIIAKLPLELSQMILQRLPLSQVFQARRVSSQWNQILSLPQTLEPLICKWFPPSTDTDLHIPDGLSASSILSLKAEHIESYRTGHAFTYAWHEWDCFPHDLNLNLVAYADGVIVWVDTTDSHLVKSLDLKTGEEWSFLPEARTRVMSIATSSSMVAALGSDRCHVWTFRTGDWYCLRMPSASVSDIAVSGESLAIFDHSKRLDASPRVDVLTWTLKDKRTCSFPMALALKKGSHSSLRTMLDNKGESLLLVEWIYEFCEARSAHIYYSRINLDGNILTQGVIQVPHPIDYHCDSLGSALKEANGQALLWSFAKCQHVEDDASELILICYNFRDDCLEVRTQMIRDLRMGTGTKIDLLCWKDAAFFLDFYKGRPSLRVIDFHDLTCNKAKLAFPANAPVCDDNGWVEPEVLLFGDETFLIYVYFQGFSVWCFDANVQLFNEDVAYKEERKSRMAKRIRGEQKEKAFQL